MKFSINLLQSTAEQRQSEDKYQDLVEACEEQNIEYGETIVKEAPAHRIIDIDELDNKANNNQQEVNNNKVINLDDSEDELDDEVSESDLESKDKQEEFRSQLLKDIKEDEEVDLGVKNDEHAAEKQIDEEKLDEEQLDDLNNSY